MTKLGTQLLQDEGHLWCKLCARARHNERVRMRSNLISLISFFSN